MIGASPDVTGSRPGLALGRPRSHPPVLRATAPEGETYSRPVTFTARRDIRRTKEEGHAPRRWGPAIMAATTLPCRVPPLPAISQVQIENWAWTNASYAA